MGASSSSLSMMPAGGKSLLKISLILIVVVSASLKKLAIELEKLAMCGTSRGRLRNDVIDNSVFGRMIFATSHGNLS
jgi:hypothetical protein